MSFLRAALPVAALFVGSTFLISTAQAAPDLIVNGNFETPSVTGNFATYTSTNTPANFGWTVVSGSIDHISSSYWQGSPGQSIDLDGDAAGTISQTLTTTVGQNYQLTFDLAGNPNGDTKQVEVLWGGVSAGTFSFNTAGKSLTNMGWTTSSAILQAQSTSTTLQFRSLTPGAQGPALDNIHMVATSASAAPEPGTVALLLTTSLPVAGLVLRRRKPSR